MAHKTLIGGTAYEISGGRTLINGTAYSIAGGKTLVGGTAYGISFGPPALANCTPAQIQQVAQSGQAPNYWAVGDKVSITLNGTVGALSLSGTYYAFIIGFNHNSSIEGNNTIHFQFGKTDSGVDIAFVDGNYNSSDSSAGFRMSTDKYNTGGWASSYMRSTICPAFLAAMPSAWQSVIKACTKYSDNTGGGSDTASYVTSTVDKIWLLAEFEVFGTRSNANSAEQNFQKWYDYYKTVEDPRKKKFDKTSSGAQYWLRSVSASSGKSFIDVSAFGFSEGTYANYSFGFAPCFMVA